MLTTTEAAALLQERGIKVAADTVKHWCQRGRFPRARRAGKGQRGVWLIPREDVEAFQQRPGGRPRTAPKGEQREEG